MTSEERWTKIENALQTIAENQAKHDAHLARHDDHLARHDDEMQELRRLHKSTVVAVGKLIQAQHRTEKNVNALSESMGELRDLHKDSEYKLNALIDTVEKFIHKPNGHQG